MIACVEFASPRDDVNPVQFDAFPRAYVRAVTKRLQRDVGDGALGGAPDLPATETERCSAFWAPEIGSACASARRGDQTRGWVQAALGLMAQGREGDWRLQIGDPTPVSFAGFCFDLSGDVSCRHAAGQLTLSAAGPSGQREISFRRSDIGWRVADAAPCAALAFRAPSFLATAGFEDRYVIATEAAEDDASDALPAWPPVPCGPDASTFQRDAAAQTDAALSLICDLGPRYRAWLSPMFRGIVASPRVETTLNKSGSCPEHPGMIHVAFPVGAEQLGEMLIHEVSHQYFFLSEYIHPLTDGGDGAFYYSSLKQTLRRVDRILLALHATGNMVVYWSDLIAQRGETPERVAALAAALEHTRHMGAIADASAGLTAAGRRIWEIQKTLIADRGLSLDAH